MSSSRNTLAVGLPGLHRKMILVDDLAAAARICEH